MWAAQLMMNNVLKLAIKLCKAKRSNRFRINLCRFITKSDLHIVTQLSHCDSIHCHTKSIKNVATSVTSGEGEFSVISDSYSGQCVIKKYRVSYVVSSLKCYLFYFFRRV